MCVTIPWDLERLSEVYEAIIKHCKESHILSASVKL